MIVYESIHFLFSVLHALFVFPLPQHQKESKTQSPKYWSIVAAPPVKLEQAPVKFSEHHSGDISITVENRTICCLKGIKSSGARLCWGLEMQSKYVYSHTFVVVRAWLVMQWWHKWFPSHHKKCILPLSQWAFWYQKPADNQSSIQSGLIQSFLQLLPAAER